MSDKLSKYLAFDDSIRLYVVDGSETIEEIRRRQESSSEVTTALGRLALAVVMIGALSSEEIKLYARVDGKGAAGRLYADGDAHGHVRAYAQYPQVQLPPTENGMLDIASTVGTDGELVITRDFGLREMQQASTKLVSGEIGDDVASFFALSEQIPSAVGLAVSANDEQVKHGYGFIAQVLPNCSEEVIALLEENLNNMPPMLTYLETKTLDEFVAELTSGTARKLEEFPVAFQCNCSKEKFINALYALPKSEIEEMLQDESSEEIICEYCSNVYTISNDELKEILQGK